MKELACCLAMVKDEGIFMPLWLAHYLKTFPASDLYVHSDESTDDTATHVALAGANFVSVTPGTIQPGHNDRYIKGVITGLLEQYQCVLFAESPDDIIWPREGTLRAYLEQFVTSTDTHRFLTACNVMPNGQAIRCPQYDNPFLWKVTPTWGRGWHDLGGQRLVGQGDGSLWNLHIHYADFDLCNARHQQRKRSYTAEQQRLYACWTDDELKNVMAEMSSDPQKWFTDGQIFELEPWMKGVMA